MNMKDKNSKINRPNKSALLSVSALCLFLFFTIQCGLLARQNLDLSAENETLSAALADKEQAVETREEETQEEEIYETETGFLKKNGVYLIDDIFQLWTLRQMIADGTEIEPGAPAAAASYRLRNDIDFLSWDSPVPMFYLGTEKTPFCGSFDGDGHCIRGYFPLSRGADGPEAMFCTDTAARIQDLIISNQTDNIGHKGVSAELSSPWEVEALEKRLPGFPDCSVKINLSGWDLEAQLTAKRLRRHWDKLLAQEEVGDCYVSMTFLPEDEESEGGIASIDAAARDMRIHGAYIQELQAAFLTLSGTEYADIIEEAIEKEDGYLWFLRLERLEGLTCCTFEIGRPAPLPDGDAPHYYLIVEGEWEGKEVPRQCFSIPYTFFVWYSIGNDSDYKIECVDLNFDGKADLLIHEGSSQGSGGFWDNYRALVWEPDSGQFSYFPSFPEQVSRLEFNRRRVVLHGESGWGEESVSVYEIVDGEYVCTKEWRLNRNPDDHRQTVTSLSYYEMGQLVETHVLSDIDERDILYPDLEDYWFRG